MTQAAVCSRGGSGQHARPAAGVFRGTRGLRGDQRRVQTTAEPRGRGSVGSLQHSERGIQAQHTLTQLQDFSTPPLVQSPVSLFCFQHPSLPVCVFSKRGLHRIRTDERIRSKTALDFST